MGNQQYTSCYNVQRVSKIFQQSDVQDINKNKNQQIDQIQRQEQKNLNLQVSDLSKTQNKKKDLNQSQVRISMDESEQNEKINNSNFDKINQTRQKQSKKNQNFKNERSKKYYQDLVQKAARMKFIIWIFYLTKSFVNQKQNKRLIKYFYQQEQKQKNQSRKQLQIDSENSPICDKIEQIQTILQSGCQVTIVTDLQNMNDLMSKFIYLSPIKVYQLDKQKDKQKIKWSHVKKIYVLPQKNENSPMKKIQNLDKFLNSKKNKIQKIKKWKKKCFKVQLYQQSFKSLIRIGKAEVNQRPFDNFKHIPDGKMYNQHQYFSPFLGFKFDDSKQLKQYELNIKTALALGKDQLEKYRQLFIGYSKSIIQIKYSGQQNKQRKISFLKTIEEYQNKKNWKDFDLSKQQDAKEVLKFYIGGLAEQKSLKSIKKENFIQNQYKTNEFQIQKNDNFYYHILNGTLKSIRHIQQVSYCFFPIYEMCKSLQTIYRKQTQTQKLDQDQESSYREIPYKGFSKQRKQYVLWRATQIQRGDIQLLRKKINFIFTLYGFVSTSKSRQIAQGFLNHKQSPKDSKCLFKILMPNIKIFKQHWGYDAPFGDISDINPFQKEVIFPPLSYFRIKNIYQQNEITIIELEYSILFDILKKYQSQGNQPKSKNSNEYEVYKSTKAIKLLSDKIETIADGFCLFGQQNEQIAEQLWKQKKLNNVQIEERKLWLKQQADDQNERQAFKFIKKISISNQPIQDKRENKKNLQIKEEAILKILQKQNILQRNLPFNQQIKQEIKLLQSQGYQKQALILQAISKNQALLGQTDNAFKMLHQIKLDIQNELFENQKLLNEKKKENKKKSIFSCLMRCICCKKEDSNKQQANIKQTSRIKNPKISKQQVGNFLTFFERLGKTFQLFRQSGISHRDIKKIYKKYKNMLQKIKKHYIPSEQQEQRVNKTILQNSMYQQNLDQINKCYQETKYMRQKDNKKQQVILRCQRLQHIVNIKSQINDTDEFTQSQASYSDWITEENQVQTQIDALDQIQYIKQIVQNQQNQIPEHLKQQFNVLIIEFFQCSNKGQINPDITQRKSKLEQYQEKIYQEKTNQFLSQNYQFNIQKKDEALTLLRANIYISRKNYQLTQFKTAQDNLKKSKQVLTKVKNYIQQNNIKNSSLQYRLNHQQTYRIPLIQARIMIMMKKFDKAQEFLQATKNKLEQKYSKTPQYKIGKVYEELAILMLHSKQIHKYDDYFKQAIIRYQNYHGNIIKQAYCRLRYAHFMILSDCIFDCHKIATQIIKAGSLFCRNSFENVSKLWYWHFVVLLLKNNPKFYRPLSKILNKRIQSQKKNNKEIEQKQSKQKIKISQKKMMQKQIEMLQQQYSKSTERLQNINQTPVKSSLENIKKQFPSKMNFTEDKIVIEKINQLLKQAKKALYPKGFLLQQIKIVCTQQKRKVSLRSGNDQLFKESLSEFYDCQDRINKKINNRRLPMNKIQQSEQIDRNSDEIIEQNFLKSLNTTLANDQEQMQPQVDKIKNQQIKMKMKQILKEKKDSIRQSRLQLQKSLLTMKNKKMSLNETNYNYLSMRKVQSQNI